jgi:hypothetical protein
VGSIFERAIGVCPPGSFVVNITGRSRWWVRGIGPLGCSDGTTVDFPQGIDDEATTNTVASVTGFASANLRAGDGIDQFQPVPKGGVAEDYFGGTGGAEKTPLECPSNGLVVGMVVHLGTFLSLPYSDAVMQVRLLCFP